MLKYDHGCICRGARRSYEDGSNVTAAVAAAEVCWDAVLGAMSCAAVVAAALHVLVDI
jgi:hypothetical protein